MFPGGVRLGTFVALTPPLPHQMSCLSLLSNEKTNMPKQTNLKHTVFVSLFGLSRSFQHHLGSFSRPLLDGVSWNHALLDLYSCTTRWENSPGGNCCSFVICRLKSLHDSVVGMCSAGSSNVNILHPPSHSPVPGPGIPLPSNGRLVPALFLFLSVAHKHTQTYALFVPMQLLQTISFLPYLPHTFLHFLFAAMPSFTLPSFHLFFLPPFNKPSISIAVCPSAALSFWVYLHGRA